MSQSAVVAFGFHATEAAMSAKAGSLGVRGKLRLARAAMTHSSQIPFCCDEVEFFLATVEGRPLLAANRLLAFVTALAPSEAKRQPEFDWQRRADLQ